MIATESTKPLPSVLPAGQITPRLQHGDHLTLAEFERRYDADPLLKKAELIDGIVYMASPVRHTHHADPHFATIGWLDRYVESTPGTAGGADGSIRLDPKSMPQPDAYLFIRPEYGGRVRFEEGYVAGAPELVVEIAASSVSYDLHEKLQVYRRNGVGEYIVWRVEDNAIDWFALRAGGYEPFAATDGVFQSVVFPGLWLDAAAMVALDRARVSQVLGQGLAAAEHAAFIQKLGQQKVSK